MAGRSGSYASMQYGWQVLAAAEEMHRQANKAAGLMPASSGVLDEARTFASQAPEPLLLAQQLMGATMKEEQQPLYSGFARVFSSPAETSGQQQAALPHHFERHIPTRPPAPRSTRFASLSAPEYVPTSHSVDTPLGAARTARQQQQPEAEGRIKQHEAASSWRHRGMWDRRGGRNVDVDGLLREVRAEHRAFAEDLQQVPEAPGTHWEGGETDLAMGTKHVLRTTGSTTRPAYSGVTQPSRPPTAFTLARTPAQGGRWPAGEESTADPAPVAQPRLFAWSPPQ